ncbi:hypothetical protein RCL1_009141 [Eukaryota sp. TZLM3-RCL]
MTYILHQLSNIATTLSTCLSLFKTPQSIPLASTTDSSLAVSFDFLGTKIKHLDVNVTTKSKVSYSLGKNHVVEFLNLRTPISLLSSVLTDIEALITSEISSEPSCIMITAFLRLIGSLTLCFDSFHEPFLDMIRLPDSSVLQFSLSSSLISVCLLSRPSVVLEIKHDKIKHVCVAIKAVLEVLNGMLSEVRQGVCV